MAEKKPIIPKNSLLTPAVIGASVDEFTYTAMLGPVPAEMLSLPSAKTQQVPVLTSRVPVDGQHLANSGLFNPKSHELLQTNFIFTNSYQSRVYDNSPPLRNAYHEYSDDYFQNIIGNPSVKLKPLFTNPDCVSMSMQNIQNPIASEETDAEFPNLHGLNLSFSQLDIASPIIPVRVEDPDTPDPTIAAGTTFPPPCLNAPYLPVTAFNQVKPEEIQLNTTKFENLVLQPSASSAGPFSADQTTPIDTPSQSQPRPFGAVPLYQSASLQEAQPGAQSLKSSGGLAEVSKPTGVTSFPGNLSTLPGLPVPSLSQGTLSNQTKQHSNPYSVKNTNKRKSYIQNQIGQTENSAPILINTPVLNEQSYTAQSILQPLPNPAASIAGIPTADSRPTYVSGGISEVSPPLAETPVLNLNPAPASVPLSQPLPAVPAFSSPSPFTASPQLPPALPPQSTQGSGISYRRQQTKVTYAPIPGISKSELPSVLPVFNWAGPSLEPSTNSSESSTGVNLFHPSQSSSSESSIGVNLFHPSQSSSESSTGVNLFHPSSSSSVSSSQWPQIPIREEIQSLDCTPSEFLIPTMSNINIPVVPSTSSPASDAPATLNSSTTLHTIRSPNLPESQDIRLTSTPKPVVSSPYRTVYHHWFHRREIEGRVIWQPFSMVDSLALEAAFVSTDISPEYMVKTDGGRYDVNILRRQRISVYWESTPTEVRRCSWFYKANNDGRFTPYEENIATKLEEEYKAAYEVNQWQRKVELANGETVIFHAPDVLVLFPQATSPDTWNNTTQSAIRPRVVKRGMDEFDIDEGEPSKIDHLLLLVHGIGSVCDLKFRSVEEVVDDFRSISLQLVQSHYKSSCEIGKANRIEVLPVSWHNQLHSEDTGIDRKLKSITLESIPRLRDFTNDTLLDILFYTSPIYCQTIISTVGDELNRIYDLFKERNPGFQGNVSVGGHSLGSLILFDILCHQKPVEKEEEKVAGDDDEDTVPPMKHVEKPLPLHRRMSRRISYMMGAVGTGQPQLTYPHLNFHPIAFFALGSPIGMFVTVRGLESLGEHFALPTCPGFFNIFHPYDPVAYRIESLINPELANARPVLIPHHKGRKRMHLELKETMARVGADLKQRIFDSMKNTWNSVYQLTMFNKQDTKSIEAEVDMVLQEQMSHERQERVRTDSTSEDDSETDLPVGMLNNGRRIDFVLQEAPFEFFNEYIFALTSHVCYWESEDTMLLILKEIYSSLGVSTDSQIPQQTMTIERSTPSPLPGVPHSMQMANPLRPMVYSPTQEPPPTSGFLRKT